MILDTKMHGGFVHADLSIHSFPEACFKIQFKIWPCDIHKIGAKVPK